MHHLGAEGQKMKRLRASMALGTHTDAMLESKDAFSAYSWNIFAFDQHGKGEMGVYLAVWDKEENGKAAVMKMSKGQLNDMKKLFEDATRAVEIYRSELGHGTRKRPLDTSP